MGGALGVPVEAHRLAGRRKEAAGASADTAEQAPLHGRTAASASRPGIEPADEAEHQTCFACHAANVRAHDFVFTRLAR